MRYSFQHEGRASSPSSTATGEGTSVVRVGRVPGWPSLSYSPSWTGERRGGGGREGGEAEIAREMEGEKRKEGGRRSRGQWEDGG